MYLQTAITEVLAALRRERLSPKTVDTYAKALAGFARILEGLGITDVREVTRKHIESHQVELRKTTSARTTAQRIQAVRRLFRYLGEHGHLLINPAEEVVALKYGRGLPRRHVTEEEMTKLLAAPNVSLRHGIRDKAVLEVLYATGMRVGEIAALEVSDIDLQLGLVRIRDGKGHKERIVPLGTTAGRWTKEYLERVRPWWMRGKGHERRLWVTMQGRPLQVNNVQHLLRIYSAKAGVKAIYPHAIRHATATHMLARGADLRAIQKLLGHKSLATTQRYTQVVPLEVKGTHAKTHPLEVEP